MFAYTQYTYCTHSFSISRFYRCVVYQWTLLCDFFLGCFSFLLILTWKVPRILSTFEKSLHYGFMIGISRVFLFLPINLYMSILFPKSNGDQPMIIYHRVRNEFANDLINSNLLDREIQLKCIFLEKTLLLHVNWLMERCTMLITN